MLKESFDPIRIRLRLMPISRARAKGMNADYYFFEAGKKSMRGNLTAAIEQLKRGLLLNPQHFLCRFNHGVLMFKFGLITEAAQDFYELTENCPKEPWAHYNLAICLLQMGLPLPISGDNHPTPSNKHKMLLREKVTDITTLTSNQRYEMISALCTDAIELAKDTDDKELTIDCYFL